VIDIVSPSSFLDAGRLYRVSKFPGLIIAGIVDKNRRTQQDGREMSFGAGRATAPALGALARRA